LDNNTPPPTATLHSVNPAVDYVASTFDTAHDRGLSTALYTGKVKFVLYEQSYNVTETTEGGRADAYLADGDQGRNKIDHYEYQAVGGTSAAIVTSLTANLANNPYDYTFLHLMEPDSVGHLLGWRSSQWNDSVASVDDYLGQVFQQIDASTNLRDSTAIILTADHGGSLINHNDTTDPDIFTIPFFVWGPGVAPGADLYDLNQLTRRDPGNAQVSYLEPIQPIRNGDSGNLAMMMLGLPSIEGSSINARQDLRYEPPVVAMWDASASGKVGDGTRWQDSANWSRGAAVDRLPISGDIVVLPAMASPQTIQLGGTRQIHSLMVNGHYALVQGNLEILTGEVTVEAGAELTVVGGLASPRDVIKGGDGVLTVEDGVLSDVMISDGRLEGNFRVLRDAANVATVSPGGDELGTIQVDRLFAQIGAGRLEMQIAANGASDRLVLAQSNYTGVLSIRPLGDGVEPEPGSFMRWTLIENARRVRRFSTIEYAGQALVLNNNQTDHQQVHVEGGLFRHLIYTPTGVDFINYRALAGDANGDGIFGTPDLVAVFVGGVYEDGDNDNANWLTGDWDGDLDFTTSDLVAAFRTGRYEQPSILPASMAVPEPAGCSLMLAGLIAAVLTRRRSLPASLRPLRPKRHA
jgi:hypothetical protein